METCSHLFGRIIRAGGGTVLSPTTLKELIEKNTDLDDDLNTVVLDNIDHHDWKLWKEIVQKKRNFGLWTDLRHVQYKYFFSCITECERVDIDKFLIDDSEKELEGKKRELDQRDIHDINVKRFKKNPLVVDLDNESSDDDIEILEQKLLARKTTNRRVYIENIDIADSDENDDDDLPDPSGHQLGISVGLQKAISALQPQKRTRNDITKDSRLHAEADSDDEIEIVMTKPGESRKVLNCDRRTVLFQSRLKELKEVPDIKSEDDDISGSSEASQNDSLTNHEPQRSPSPVDRTPVEPVEIPSPPMPVPLLDDTNKKGVYQIIDCILERQSVTGECYTVGFISNKSVKYDRHSESKLSGASQSVANVDTSVREEFYQKFFDKPSENENSSLVNQLSQVSNIISSLRFLKSYTCYTSHPTPAIINSLMMDCILNQDNQVQRRKRKF